MSKFLNHGSKVDAIRAACCKLGLRSKLSVVQREAAIILKAQAVRNREYVIKMQNIEVEAYTPLIKKYENDTEVRARAERCVKLSKQRVSEAKAELKEIKASTCVHEWVDYQQTCLVRKKIQREKNQVSDCRSYTGQPLRDMRI